MNFYDKAGFFRVVKGFVVQFGINSDPRVTKDWSVLTIKDDPVKTSNRRGTLTYATGGADTRTTELFINLRDNDKLDAQGFAPIAEVVDGMNVVDSLYAGYGDGPPFGPGPDQKAIEDIGNPYLEEHFLSLDYIKKARIEL